MLGHFITLCMKGLKSFIFEKLPHVLVLRFQCTSLWHFKVKWDSPMFVAPKKKGTITVEVKQLRWLQNWFLCIQRLGKSVLYFYLLLTNKEVYLPLLLPFAQLTSIQLFCFFFSKNKKCKISTLAKIFLLIPTTSSIFYELIISEAALHRCSYKKLFWKYAANLQEYTHV